MQNVFLAWNHMDQKKPKTQESAVCYDIILPFGSCLVSRPHATASQTTKPVHLCAHSRPKKKTKRTVAATSNYCAKSSSKENNSTNSCNCTGSTSTKSNSKEAPALVPASPQAVPKQTPAPASPTPVTFSPPSSTANTTAAAAPWLAGPSLAPAPTSPPSVQQSSNQINGPDNPACEVLRLSPEYAFGMRWVV